MSTAVWDSDRGVWRGIRVVTIARTFSAGGEAVAVGVARELGFRYVDDQIVVEAAQAAGLAPEVIDAAEHGHAGVAAVLSDVGERSRSVGDAGPPNATTASTAAAYGGLIRHVIEDTANEGDAVIVAHGAGIHLAGRPDVLQVLVTGSRAGRAARLSEHAQLSEAEAHAQIDAADAERSAFLKRFYDLDAELPAHYDLVLNTDALTLAVATRLVVEAVRG